ncbi:hypothetical protein WR25_07438 isoform A [Diploscapter pachys]|uniref:SXP/RAL-2 family protein Ani s 5-like cation-binding domain-containing protein n=2 Tax=Diploscapter pachys TaxID=2018661 RepID=A0A2A2JT17_9BILA|nr:hypothetical protein WR25_07438 isoform A [Diploscapter pachys]
MSKFILQLFLLAFSMYLIFPGESQDLNSTGNGSMSEESLARSLQKFEADSKQIIDEYLRNGKKLKQSLRSRLILFLIQYIPVQDVVMETNNQELKDQVAAINARLKSTLQFKYNSVKSIDKLIGHMMAVLLAPFILINPLPAPGAITQPPTTQAPSLPVFQTVQQSMWPSFDTSSQWGQPQWSQPSTFQWPSQPSPSFVSQSSFSFQQPPATSQFFPQNTVFMPAANNPSPAPFLPFRSEFVQPSQQFVWNNGLYRYRYIK